MIELDRALNEQMRSYGADTYKKFLCKEMIRHWDKIVDESISAYVKPVTIEHGVLFVDVANSAFKDQLKFLTEEIIDAVNENFGAELFVKEIKLAKAFQVADLPPEKISPAQIEQPELTLEDITLTEEEIQLCKEQAEKISDPKLRLIVSDTLLSRLRMKKFRLATGWHKCAKCNSLCPPNEMFCEVCNVKERANMVETLFKIFYDKPWLKTLEAQKLLLEKMPHMSRECSPDVIESARTSLIQRIASRVRFGDDSSPDALKLVMLEKRLPPEKLTPAIIKRALSDLQFNLSGLPRYR